VGVVAAEAQMLLLSLVAQAALGAEDKAVGLLALFLLLLEQMVEAQAAGLQTDTITPLELIST
jgi:hypothetical protein